MTDVNRAVRAASPKEKERYLKAAKRCPSIGRRYQGAAEALLESRKGPDIVTGVNRTVWDANLKEKAGLRQSHVKGKGLSSTEEASSWDSSRVT